MVTVMVFSATFIHNQEWWSVVVVITFVYMVVGFTITYVQSVPITTNVVSSNSSHGNTIVCDKFWHWLATGQWFSLGTPVSSTNKTDCHDIAEILLKVALNTITVTITPFHNNNYAPTRLHIFTMVLPWEEFELTTLVVIGTDCT
jgi:hypothetical protein